MSESATDTNITIGHPWGDWSRGSITIAPIPENFRPKEDTVDGFTRRGDALVHEWDVELDPVQSRSVVSLAHAALDRFGLAFENVTWHYRDNLNQGN